MTKTQAMDQPTQPRRASTGELDLEDHPVFGETLACATIQLYGWRQRHVETQLPIERHPNMATQLALERPPKVTNAPDRSGARVFLVVQELLEILARLAFVPRLTVRSA